MRSVFQDMNFRVAEMAGSKAEGSEVLIHKIQAPESKIGSSERSQIKDIL